MSVSNKTLSILLLAAIVVSLGGTFVSLNRLGSISTTGFVTEDGTVSLEIGDNLAIELEDSTVNFGECQLGDNSAGITINTEGVGEADNGNCASQPPGITVKNVGNLDAVIALSTSDRGTEQGGTFLDTGTTESELRYRSDNVDGCDSGLQPDYAIVTDTEQSGVDICTHLNAPTGGAENSFITHFEIDIPDSATGVGHSVTITFEASEV